MPWITIENPSKELLDSLWAERVKSSKKTCHDCGVKPGEKHLPGCDVARCLNCGGQRLSCDCDEELGDGDVWDGFWPGTKECYEKGYVARWECPGQESYFTFDYNRLALDRIKRSNNGKRSSKGASELGTP